MSNDDRPAPTSLGLMLSAGKPTWRGGRAVKDNTRDMRLSDQVADKSTSDDTDVDDTTPDSPRARTRVAYDVALQVPSIRTSVGVIVGLGGIIIPVLLLALLILALGNQLPFWFPIATPGYTPIYQGLHVLAFLGCIGTLKQATPAYFVAHFLFQICALVFDVFSLVMISLWLIGYLLQTLPADAVGTAYGYICAVFLCGLITFANAVVVYCAFDIVMYIWDLHTQED